MWQCLCQQNHILTKPLPHSYFKAACVTAKPHNQGLKNSLATAQAHCPLPLCQPQPLTTLSCISRARPDHVHRGFFTPMLTSFCPSCTYKGGLPCWGLLLLMCFMYPVRGCMDEVLSLPAQLPHWHWTCMSSKLDVRPVRSSTGTCNVVRGIQLTQ